MIGNTFLPFEREDIMKEKAAKTVKLLFVVRVILWLIALICTAYWMYYSHKLHLDGIFDPHEYATLLRPVLYTNLIISIVAVCASFALYALSRKIKKEHDLK